MIRERGAGAGAGAGGRRGWHSMAKMRSLRFRVPTPGGRFLFVVAFFFSLFSGRERGSAGGDGVVVFFFSIICSSFFGYPLFLSLSFWDAVLLTFMAARRPYGAVRSGRVGRCHSLMLFFSGRSHPRFGLLSPFFRDAGEDETCYETRHACFSDLGLSSAVLPSVFSRSLTGTRARRSPRTGRGADKAVLRGFSFRFCLFL